MSPSAREEEQVNSVNVHQQRCPPPLPHQSRYNREKTPLSHAEKGWAGRGPQRCGTASGVGTAFQTTAANTSPSTAQL